MFCSNCGKELIGKPEVCPNCGARVNVAEPASGHKTPIGSTFCQACGTPVNPQAIICIKCGAPLTKDKNDLVKTGELGISPKSRLAASLFAIFLGEFGIHRFYIGKKGSAVAMLLLGIIGVSTWWLGVGLVPLIIVGIWALVDFIIAVSGQMKDKDGKLIKLWRT